MSVSRVMYNSAIYIHRLSVRLSVTCWYYAEIMCEFCNILHTNVSSENASDVVC